MRKEDCPNEGRDINGINDIIIKVFGIKIRY